MKLIAFLAIILTTGFYWFQYRPSQIKKTCTQKVIQQIQTSDAVGYNDFQDLLKICTLANGL